MTETRKIKAFVVDDDPTLRKLMCELLLSDIAVEVQEADNGAEAWSMFKSGLNADIAIVDIRLPKLSGLDLLQMLRQDNRYRQQKVIICSTLNDRSSIVRAANLGVNGYLLKPFYADVFLDRVRKVIAPVQKGRATPDEPLEPGDRAAHRLGISLQLYQDLLGVFVKELTDFVALLKSGSPEIRPEQVLNKCSAIKGAASTMGARPLVGIVARLEQLAAAGVSVCNADSVQLVDAELLRIKGTYLNASNCAEFPVTGSIQQEPPVSTLSR